VQCQCEYVVYITFEAIQENSPFLLLATAKMVHFCMLEVESFSFKVLNSSDWVLWMDSVSLCPVLLSVSKLAEKTDVFGSSQLHKITQNISATPTPLPPTKSNPKSPTNNHPCQLCPRLPLKYSRNVDILASL
jgi:hypothetical protein